MRDSRGKGKPQLPSFVLGLPVVAHYRPPVPTTGTHLAILVLTSASEEKYPSGASFRLQGIQKPLDDHGVHIMKSAHKLRYAQEECAFSLESAVTERTGIHLQVPFN